MNDLIKLYRIYNPSRSEGKMSLHVQRHLDKLGIEYNVDGYGQVYKFRTGEPLICAHMDSVSSTRPKNIRIEHGVRISGSNNIGADDKNGIWILLRMLEQHPNLSFIFSTCEEAGGNIDELDLMSLDVPYGLIFDRCGYGDIIGTYNEYCEDDLEDAISLVGDHYGYTPEHGVFSDCDALSRHIPCVNLSCGYYAHHTEQEYTMLPELLNALNFGLALIDELPRIDYKIPQKTSSWRHNYMYPYDYDQDPRITNIHCQDKDADWLCMCGTINDKYEYYCRSCYGNIFDTEVSEDDLDFCIHCGEDYVSDMWCKKCELKTFVMHNNNSQKLLEW